MNDDGTSEYKGFFDKNQIPIVFFEDVPKSIDEQIFWLTVMRASWFYSLSNWSHLTYTIKSRHLLDGGAVQ